MRINARLDQQEAAKLAYLRAKTGARTTDIIKRSIELYYEQVRQPRTMAKDALNNSGFIGCSDGAPNLSQQYKDALREELVGKTP